MSLDWNVGFKTIPSLEDLDIFMLSLGYSIDYDSENFTRIYDWLPPADAPENHREVIFYYNADIDPDYRSDFPDIDKDDILSYGCLVSPSTQPTYIGFEQRSAIIREKDVKTEREYYKYLDPERHKWYETALALRKQYDAVVVCDNRLIDPNRAFPEI